MENIRTVSINVDLETGQPVTRKRIKQGDTTQLVLNIFRCETAYDLDGLTITISAIRADNAGFVIGSGYEVFGNSIVMMLKPAYIAVPGRLRFEVILGDDDGNTISSFAVHVQVIAAQINEDTTDGGEADGMIEALYLSTRSPFIGPDGAWWQWDNGMRTFVSTGIVPGQSSGEANYKVGAGLKLDIKTYTLSVDTAEDVEQDNTKPITSAAVYETVGNINALLATI